MNMLFIILLSLFMGITIVVSGQNYGPPTFDLITYEVTINNKKDTRIHWCEHECEIVRGQSGEVYIEDGEKVIFLFEDWGEYPVVRFGKSNVEIAQSDDGKCVIFTGEGILITASQFCR